MFISKKLKKFLKENTEYLIKKQQQQELFNKETIKQINELLKKVKPIETPNYENIFNNVKK